MAMPYGLAQRWAPTLNSGHQGVPTVTTNGANAFVVDTGDKTIITGPAHIIEQAGRRPSVKEIADEHLMWMSGRFVGADKPNRNGALWSAGDLELAQQTVAHGPLNWLHEERHVIGTIARSKYVVGKEKLVPVLQTIHSSFNETPSIADVTIETASVVEPHIVAEAAIWRWIWPDEAYVIQQASDSKMLHYSMECIAQSVECAGESGCGNTTTYAEYLSGSACEHIRERSSVRRFIRPTFLGGAVIVPPVSPGWAEAEASVMKQAANLAEAAYAQAGEPDVPASEWERLMAEVLRFAGPQKTS